MTHPPGTAAGSPPEVALFNRLNQLVIPLVRAGLGSPTLLQPTGLFLLEVAGRRSGIVRQTPLLGLLAPGGLVASTVRGNSQWLRNLAAARQARVRLWGLPLTVRPWVLTAAAAPPPGAPPLLAPLLAEAARQLNLNIALLVFPAPSPAAPAAPAAPTAPPDSSS